MSNLDREHEVACQAARDAGRVVLGYYGKDPKVLAEVSEQMTGAMRGLAVGAIEERDLLQTRGW